VAAANPDKQLAAQNSLRLEWNSRPMRLIGIPETRVTKYLSEHCVVRWLQLDEGSAYFCHFAIAVLRPNLNE